MGIMTLDATANLKEIGRRISSTLQAAGRSPSSAQLITVSKTIAAVEIMPVLLAGQRLFGENRVQETSAKWPQLRSKFPDLELHLIGPLQSNKVREAVELFDVIQTIDRPKIAAALAKAQLDTGKILRCLVQVNIGSEPQKAGVEPEVADEFICSCLLDHGLNVIGIMCIPPIGDDPVPHFDKMQDIARRNGLSAISMGMSSDYEVALAHGATMVRVGSAIFGERPKLQI